MTMSELAKMTDAELIAAAFVAGVARWEWFPNRAGGELCFGGIRYSCDLNSVGVPHLGHLARTKLQEELRR